MRDGFDRRHRARKPRGEPTPTKLIILVGIAAIILILPIVWDVLCQLIRGT